ncbi:UNVERIFIED_CONTAM: protein MAINTENANCE OF MERISTEMS [Sesamum calycinum]|uniref:Protein MAINTENANCE OF MERISTEMS n=1 Tax=Sesamum calycinum TaxID=2727403 RepID=A0AAW2N5M8_9LAMI
MDRRAVYGPRDGTVLSQQSQHRSDEILDGDIDEVLQAKRADDGEPVSGTDLERTSVQWQEYCMQYIGFAPEEGVLKGSRLQYARAVALLLLGGTMCPDSSGNLVSLLYLAKLEDIVAARNYSWGSAVLAFLYRELCNASEKGKAAIGGALQLVQIWAWSRIIPLCPGLGAPRDFNPQLWRSNMSLDILCNSGDASSRTGPSPIWNDAKYSRSARYSDMSLHKITRSNRTGTDGFCSTYSTSLDDKDDMTRSYKDNPFPTEEIQIEDIGNGTTT